MGCGCGGGTQNLITTGSAPHAPGTGAAPSPGLRVDTQPNGDGLYWTGPDTPNRPQ